MSTPDLSSYLPLERSGTAPRLEPAAIKVLLDIFVRGADPYKRVVESFEVLHTRVRRSVSVTIQLPDQGFAPDQPIYVPIAPVKRGVLIDNLDVEDRAGASLPVLTRSESLDLYRIAIRLEIDRALAAKETGTGGGDPRDDEVLEVVRVMLEDISSTSLSAGAIFFDALFGDDENWLGDASPRVKALIDDDLLRALTTFFLGTAVKFVELRGVSPDERVIIKYAYDAHFDNTELGRFERMSGHRPSAFRFHTPLAFFASSYHARMKAPPGHYCANQRFEERLTASRLEVSDHEAKPIEPKYTPWDEAMYEKSDGQLPYAHLYAHELHRKEATNLNVRVEFREILPGHFGTATLIAFFEVAFLVILSIAYAPIVQHSEGVALFLAILGVAAVWMRPAFNSERLLQAPLAAKLGLLFTGIFSLLGGVNVILAAAYEAQGAGLWAGRGAMIFLCVGAAGFLGWMARGLWLAGFRKSS